MCHAMRKTGICLAGTSTTEADLCHAGIHGPDGRVARLCVFACCVFLIISGCIFSGSGGSIYDDSTEESGFRLTTRVIFRDSKASLEVTCTNVGHGTVNVTRFLPWGFNNPAISVTDPKGIVYDAMDIRNITPTIRGKKTKQPVFRGRRFSPRLESTP